MAPLTCRHPIARTVTALAAAGLLVGLVGPPAAGVAPVVAEEPGGDARVAAAIAALPGLAADALQRTGIPGLSVAVVHRGRIVYAEGFGVRDVDTGQPVTTDTVFQIASMSKSVGAAVVAAAVGKGVVSWDDRVVEHLPWFRLADRSATRQVTLGDLYTMRSGLPGQAGDVLEQYGFSREQILRRLRLLPLTAAFRTEHQYTNFGLTAAAEAVSRAAGTPWARLSQRLVYGPLGMTHTSSRYADFLAEANRAALHVKVDGRFVSRYTRDPDAQSPAGGVSSTVLDIARWMAMEMAEGRFEGVEVVDPDALAAAQTPYSRTSPADDPTAPPRFYGYGMGVSEGERHDVRLTHSGAFSMGAGTTYLMIPAYDVGIVALSNAFVGVPEALTSAFADIVETGAVTRDWLPLVLDAFAPYYAPNPAFTPDRRPADPAPARPLRSYTGTYRNGFYGPVDVVRRGGGLRMVIGPDRVAVQLRHWDGDEYVADLSAGRDWPSLVGVTFAGNPGGRARTVDIEAGPSQVGLLRRK